MTLLYDVLDAYLTPLLTKHASGNYLLYNDLISSYNAAQDVLKRDSNHQAHRIVSKRLEDLHNSQLGAYQEAAQKALREYSQQCKIESCENGTDVDVLLKKIDRPAWNVDDSVWQECFFEPLKERLAEEQKNSTDNHQFTTDDDDAGDEDESEQEDEDDNDASMEDEDNHAAAENDDNDEADESADKPTPKPKAIKKQKKKALPAKAKVTLVRKTGTKTSMASAGALGNPRNTRGRKARRGGRGAKKAAPA